MGGLDQLESLGSSLMELSLQCLENNIMEREITGRTALRKEISSLTEKTLLAVNDVRIDYQSESEPLVERKISTLRSLLGWVELVLDRCLAHGLSTDKLIARVAKRMLENPGRGWDKPMPVALLWCASETLALQAGEKTLKLLPQVVKFCVACQYCSVMLTLYRCGALAVMETHLWTSAEEFFEHCNAEFIELSLQGFASRMKIRSMFSRTKYFLLACGKLMEAVVAKAERSEEFELEQFRPFMLVAHDLGLALSALTEETQRSGARSPSKGLTLEDGVFFTHGPEESMKLDEVNRKWMQELFTRLLQDSDDVGLQGIKYGQFFCKHLDANAAVSANRRFFEASMLSILRFCDVVVDAVKAQLESGGAYSYLRKLLELLLETVHMVCIRQRQKGTASPQRLSAPPQTNDTFLSVARPKPALDFRKNAASTLLPVAGDIFRQAARFTSKKQAEGSGTEERKFWRRMSCLAFEILGESREHWTVLFRGGASIWVSEGFVSSFEAAAAIVRCAAQLYSLDLSTGPSEMTRKGVLTSLQVLFDLLPKVGDGGDEGRRSSVQVTGEYTVLMYTARVLLLQYLQLRHDFDEVSRSKEVDYVTEKLALLVPDFCERATIVTLLYKLPSTLALVWSTLAAVIVGDIDGNLSKAGRQCLLHFLRVLSKRGDTMLVQWATGTLDIDAEPMPWSKSAFSDLIDNMTELSKSDLDVSKSKPVVPMSKYCYKPFHPRKAMQEVEAAKKDVEALFRSDFLPFHGRASRGSLPNHGGILEQLNDFSQTLESYSALWRWRRSPAVHEKVSIGAIGRVCVSIEYLVGESLRPGSLRGKLMACHLSWISGVLAQRAEDAWEGGNCFARSAELLEPIKQSKLMEKLVDQALWNLKRVGAANDLKMLLGRYVKVNVPKPKESTLASFYFLVGIESAEATIPVPELSVIRMVRKRNDNESYEHHESALIERLQRGLGLRYAQGCLRWVIKKRWANDPTSTLATAYLDVDHMFRENPVSMSTAAFYRKALQISESAADSALNSGKFWIRRLWPMDSNSTTEDERAAKLARSPATFVMLPYAQDDSQYTADWNNPSSDLSSPQAANQAILHDQRTGILSLDRLVLSCEAPRLSRYMAQAPVKANVRSDGLSLSYLLAQSSYGSPEALDGTPIGPVEAELSLEKEPKIVRVVEDTPAVIGPPPSHPPPPLDPPPLDDLENINYMPPPPPSEDEEASIRSKSSSQATEEEKRTALESAQTESSTHSQTPIAPPLPPPLPPSESSLPPPPSEAPPEPPPSVELDESSLDSRPGPPQHPSQTLPSWAKASESESTVGTKESPGDSPAERVFENPILAEAAEMLDASSSRLQRLAKAEGQIQYKMYHGVRVSVDDIALIKRFERHGEGSFSCQVIEKSGLRDVVVRCVNPTPGEQGSIGATFEVKDARNKTKVHYALNKQSLTFQESSTPGVIRVIARERASKGEQPLLIRTDRPSLLMATAAALAN